VLTSTDRRALRRFIEQSVDHGFRLAIVEAISEDREAILAELAPSIGTGLLRIDVSSLPGADENLWLALQPQITASTRCLALWGIESRTAPDWPRQLNVQRDLFVRDLGVPWLLFIHPATRVPLLQSAPDFCDFAVLWVRAETPDLSEPAALQVEHEPFIGLQLSSAPEQRETLPPLLRGAAQALEKAEFAKVRDALARFDLQGDHSLIDRVRRQVLGARLEHAQGHYALAEAILRDSQDLIRQLPPTVATELVALEVFYVQGQVLRSSARYAEAETLFLRSLAIAEKAQGVEHPNYGALLHALAGAVAAQGKYAEAEWLHRRSLAIAEKALGLDHPNYGASLHALAGMLAAQGKYVEAETLHRRSLAVEEKALGLEHPSYATSLHALADVLFSQGKYGEAETLLHRSLAIVEKALGLEHPSYATSLHALACMLAAQGKYAEAEALLRRSLAIDEKALGPEHPFYATSLQVLAGVLASQGKYAEAEKLLRRSLAVSEKALGVEHPSYGASLHALAGVLDSQGKYAEAQKLLRRSLAVSEKALGVEHPSYGASLHALASVLFSQGKYAEAEALLRRSLAVKEKALGIEHPMLCPTLSYLAAVLTQQSKAADGLPLLQRAHTIATKVLGSLHPEVGQILSQLAQVQAVLKLPEAPQTAQQALAVLTQCLGPRHPRTQEARRLYEQLTSPPP
jgi:tetratricopeptide (TPR) repeat protein